MNLPFTKGHGTENDFVLIPDLDGELDLAPAQVALLADRRAGIGGDGVIRIVRTAKAAEEDVRALAGEAEWFMDYRNADGTLAQMCGNGTRVFATWLRREGLVGETFAIATRAGIRQIRFEGDEVVTHMGTWRFVDEAKAQAQGFDSLVHVEEAEDITEPYSALSLDLGNPHTVVALPENVNLNGIRLRRPPAVNPVPPEGSNVEFVR
ncbi:MAG: diaminopimelate epimerase, partial [Janibacter sp.]|nr:diaminopimelate epimerase [Janibacter sp.]